MADLKGYTTQNGVLVPDTADLKSDVEQEFTNALGQGLDLSPETPQGRQIEAETLARKEVLNNNALIANALNPNTSFGVFLDALSALTGTTRRWATHTLVLCTLTGSPGSRFLPCAQNKENAGPQIFSKKNSFFLGDGD